MIEGLAWAVLVGFGETTEMDEGTGPKRSVVAPFVATLATGELRIGNDTAGTCYGDSGSPAFFQIGDETAPSWRLAGILSSGYKGKCGQGFYEDLTPLVGWMENAVQRDLSPCFDEDARWAPTYDCRESELDASGRLVRSPHTPFSQTCGPPFPASGDDTNPPQIQSVTAAYDATSRAVLVTVAASDDGTGIREVKIEQLDGQGRVTFGNTDELAPYEVLMTRVLPGSKLRVTVADRAGNTHQMEAIVEGREVHSGACSVAPAQCPTMGRVWLLFLAIASLRLFRRRR